MSLKALMLAALAVIAAPATAQTPAMTPDIPAKFEAPTVRNDWIKRTVMIPMRDGVRLYTVIVMKKGTHDGPILLSRTPYNAKKRAERFSSPHIDAELAQMDEPFVEDGYIRVYQDIRGKYGSEGDYIVTRPLIGRLNHTKIDHTTDTWDTIDWLVKNTPESNGRVGMIGSSYDGFTTVMGLINPHPALKAAAPESAMIDGWMGDDWFHYGAFRQKNLDYFTGQMSARGAGSEIPREAFDDYTNFLRGGSVDDYARAAGLDQIPFYNKVVEHPAYDEFWSQQALDKTLAAQPLKVPTMWIGALWDQEDMWGTIHAYLATEPKDTTNTMNYLVLGPWRHSGVNYEQRQLNAIKLPGDTATEFRTKILKPFLDEHLKTNGPKANTPPVFIFESGSMEWKKLQKWPLSCESGCAGKMKPLYLQPGQGLGFGAPPASGPAYDEYVSDPAKPVPYVHRPVRNDEATQWQYWLTTDQRHVDGRTDVLTYESAPLTAPLQISGAPIVNLFASTSGTDSDWVVKIIDVYPDTVPSQVELGGYELPIAMDIFRGRYRESFSDPKPIPAGEVEKYRFLMPTTNHVFLPGHRIMVQVQSSWFPLYDRNPQTFVPNIFFAKPADYVKATQRIFHSGAQATNIELPVVEMH
ncbi:CocE/NonD family hydrolase [Phenylobacterium sp.]|uniref:CocE/NonD family hydrolase n=1 Tax=Phenylobacterium sp. TaxID=1871053 RepID=UPI002CBCBF3D|nr:CocE/NonD family hydrolase [Phenylobacterium sp.]HLZ74823.1 CocE/NonD family hydrolase [Phenylobacterium sp.]